MSLLHPPLAGPRYATNRVRRPERHQPDDRIERREKKLAEREALLDAREKKLSRRQRAIEQREDEQDSRASVAPEDSGGVETETTSYSDPSSRPAAVAAGRKLNSTAALIIKAGAIRRGEIEAATTSPISAAARMIIESGERARSAGSATASSSMSASARLIINAAKLRRGETIDEAI